jgi:hypothetical protein
MILAVVLAVLLWVMTAVRLPTLWRGPRQRAIWAAVAALAVSRTLALPPIAAPAAQHLTAVAAAAFLLRFVMLATAGRGRRWHRVGGAVVLALFAVATAATVFSPELLSGELTPASVAYWVVLDGYLGVVLLTATALFWTTGAAAPAGLPRVALRVLAVGIGLLGIDAFIRAALTVAIGAGARLDLVVINPAAEGLQAASVLLALAGGVAAAVPRARAALSAYRALLALRPLWTAMRDAFPAIILFSPRRAVIELAGVDDVHLRLYRRVIEIRDGMLALRDFLPPERDAAGDPAQAEARDIALALARRAAGRPPVDQPGSWAPVGPEMADEVAWLRRVSRAYHRYRGGVVTRPGVRTPRPSGSAR